MRIEIEPKDEPKEDLPLSISLEMSGNGVKVMGKRGEVTKCLVKITETGIRRFTSADGVGLPVDPGQGKVIVY